jgi:molybdopterin adenylyltransferase
MQTGRLEHICISTRKGGAKQAVLSAELRADHGLVGDAHAGSGHRQVSILWRSDIEKMKVHGVELNPGAFGENLIISGLEMLAPGIGTRFSIGNTELILTQIGKVCHDRCAIYYQAGECIMPDKGIFASVTTGGLIEPEMIVEVKQFVSRDTIQAAVLTVSDRCAAGQSIDSSGPATGGLLKESLKAHIAWTGIVPDESDQISAKLIDLTDRGIDLIITTGGTGCTLRDVTPEATRAVIEREVPGLAEAMRAESRLKTPNAMLQRGVSGIRGNSLIINLPGSERGAIENLRVILPALEHAVKHLRGEPAH